MPIFSVPRLRALAPEFYGEKCLTSGSGVWRSLVDAFTTPNWYSCMGVTGDGARLSALLNDDPASAGKP